MGSEKGISEGIYINLESLTLVRKKFSDNASSGIYSNEDRDGNDDKSVFEFYLYYYNCFSLHLFIKEIVYIMKAILDHLYAN